MGRDNCEWLYWVTAKVALKRIPRNVARVLHLHIFAVNDYGDVIHFEPHEFGKEDYKESDFNM